ncbi:MAG: RagB/SusD family nutrient uptake outer membrane protein, partial [Muribaculaceae bacterium]|nr:RagB/SusD family nutrient uptake outer membrane protein [Muribaculaceae bacterium]
APEHACTSGYESYDYPIIRYAEVLLTYAEALYERDGAISDDDLDLSLNLVRLRVNPEMPKLSNKLVSDNGLSMRQEIRRERTVEFYNEGFRLDDLKRWNEAITEMPKPFLGVMWEGTEYATRGGTNTYPLDTDGCIIYEDNRQWETKNDLYPLPIDQLQLNPSLKQNPDWN